MVKRIIPSGTSVNGAAGGGKTTAKVLRSDAREISASISSGTVSTGTAHHNNRGGLSGWGIDEARVAEAMEWWGRGGATAAAAVNGV